jgi:hypothetical protein
VTDDEALLKELELLRAENEALKRARGTSRRSAAPPPRAEEPSPRSTTGVCSLPQSEQSLVREFMQALSEEIDAIKRGRGGSIITVYDGVFVRREGPFFVYVFSTRSPLVVMEDAPAEVEIGGQRFAGQIVSVQGSEVAVGIEHDCGKTIAEARLITDLSYLLEALRKRYEEVLNGQRTVDTRLAQPLFGSASPTLRVFEGDLKLPPSPRLLNEEQKAAIRLACGSDVLFIWGPPGTGKTQTIGFLVAALLQLKLRVLVVSHTNVATDNAITSLAELVEHTEDYQGGKLIRFGPPSPNTDLPVRFPLVIPENVAQRLGQHLKEQLDRLLNERGKIQPELAALRESASLLAQQEEARRKTAELRINVQRCSEEIQRLMFREGQLSAQLTANKAKLREAEGAGALKRLFLGLNPAKLQVQLAQLESELGVVRNAASAALTKQNELNQAIDRATAEANRCAQDASARLRQLGIQSENLSRRIGELAKQEDKLNSAIRAIEQELEALHAKILREAKVIATSLTKATISKQLDDQKFDALVVDEASMAPMPNLYFAAGRASQKVIVVGDFRQLPPISIAKTEMARKWLARDIFNQSRIESAINENHTEPRLIRLPRQYRMHADISSISNQIIYGGGQNDCLSAETLQRIQSFLAKSPFGNNPLVLVDVSSTNPWSSHLQQGGRYNLYSAVLTAELAKRAALAGIESIGVISPYAVHARLVKSILDDSGDARLRHLKVSTVHRFQGLEQELIIFDVAEGPMPHYGPSGLVDGVDLASQAAKLLNVSITRPRAQLAVVANVDYLRSKLARNAILLRVLERMQRSGSVIDSREIVDGYSCSDFERWAEMLDPHNDHVDPNESTLYTERNFYAAFFADLRKCQREIIIVSPFLTATRAQPFFNLFRSKVAKGIEVRVFTRPLREQRGDMLRQSEIVFEELKGIGAQVVERRGLHEKFAFVDRQVAWEGSLNILSQSEGRSTEHMRRLCRSPRPARNSSSCTGLAAIAK